MTEFQMLTKHIIDLFGKENPFIPIEQNFKKLLMNSSNQLIGFNRPIGVQLEITSFCNLNCLHCYNNSKIKKNKNNEEDIPDEIWLNVVKKLKDSGIFAITISGGEPLLKLPLLKKILEILSEDPRIAVGFITNGWLLDDDFINYFYKLPNRMKWIQISIDGATPEEHDWIRGINGSWNKAVNAAYKISKSRVHLRIAHTCNKKNYKNIWKMIELAILLGANEFIYTPVLESGRAFINKNSLILNESEKKELYKIVDDVSLEYSSKIKIIKGAEYPEYYYRFLLLPTAGILIRPNGDLKIDCSIPIVFGNLKKEDFFDIWDSRLKFGWQNEKVLNYIKNQLENKNEILPYVSKDIIAY